MEVKVLGPGCPNCKRLYDEIEKALRQLSLAVKPVKVEAIDEIVALGAMSTPALVINGEVKSAGRIPSQRELTSWLATAAIQQ
ncbi:MAG: thioredoxin family protein [Candidatus Zixiibacteriota bacterium]